MPAPFVSQIKYMHIDYFGIEYIAIQIFKYEYCHFFPGKKRIIIEYISLNTYYIHTICHILEVNKQL